MIVTQKKERFHFLDGIRGIASFMIVIHHSLTSGIAGFIDHFKIPYAGEFFRQFTQSGVDLFFVLSGVVLLRPYLRGQRKFKVGNYFIRRAKRIYPPFFFALLFGAAVVWFMTQYPTWYNVKGMHQVFSWKETVTESLIFSLSGRYYNLAWWSLQIEILFYLFVPLIILVFPKQRMISNIRVILTIVLTYGVVYYLQNLFTDHYSYFYSYTYTVSTIGKAIEYPVCFLMGIFLASRDFSLKSAYIFLCSGLLLIFIGVPLEVKSALYLSIVHSGYGLFYAGIITLAFKVNSFKHFLSKPVMVWIGERSYSLFLIHFSVFYLVDNIVSRFLTDRSVYYGLITRSVSIPTALFFAMLLFHFVERRQARGLMTDKAFWPWQLSKMHVDILEKD